MPRKPAAARPAAENFSDPSWTEDIAAGQAGGDYHFFSAGSVHNERIPALGRPPAKNAAQPHAAWRRIDKYREEKRLRDLMREVYDE
jgi:hypothetical protein